MVVIIKINFFIIIIIVVIRTAITHLLSRITEHLCGC